MSISRFYKCDLQMQTAVDRFHWRGTSILPTSTPAERTAAADAFIRRCYAVGLEVIAVTEHNFCPSDCESLVPELQAATRRMRTEFGYEIVVFPGFEVAAPIGRGAHLLCLFEPGTPMATVDAKLTQLGLPPHSRFRDRAPLPIAAADTNLNKIIEVIQGDRQVPGIVIFAHATAGSGTMDPDTVDQWWSQEVMKDERVLCMELPQAREHYVREGNNTLIANVLRNADPRYQRRHPIASICSSDCKRLEPDGDEPNFIGFRHTWIKMAQPSIEGLRQAFLDHESRIRFGEANPAERYVHPRIESLVVRGAAFLADQDIALSPNLNVFIGGSGSGKSTVLNYLRMALDQADSIQGADVRQNYDRCLETVGTQTEVSLDLVLEGEKIPLTAMGRNVAVPAPEIDVPELRTVFPVRFYGQREIYNIADSRAARARLLDNLIQGELDRLRRGAEGQVQRIRECNVKIDREGVLRTRRREVEAQIVTATLRLKKLTENAQPLEELRELEGKKAQLEELTDGVRLAAESVLSGLEAPPSLSEPSVDPPFAALRGKLTEAWNQLQGEVSQAVERFVSFVQETARLDEGVQSFTASYEEARKEGEAALRELEAQGIDPQLFATYELELRGLQTDLTAIDDELAEVSEAHDARAACIEALRASWDAEVAARQEVASTLTEAVPKTAQGSPFVRVDVLPYGDTSAFNDLMSPLIQDRRSIAADDWRDLVAGVVSSTPIGTSPVDVLTSWMQQLDAGTRPTNFPWSLEDRKTARVQEWIDASALRRLELERIPDRVVVTLYRQDGTEAGELEGGLSVGQKCTAILAILLAQDTVPAVIDQPEDEIDNEFTYRELVPLLRQVKERRQLIVATHDPNIPVVGDAEMIYALQARDGRGAVKIVDGKPAVGALDQTHVRIAVEEIMEGSEDAFLRRYDKYGF